jgi:hypothetical protein
MDGMVAAGAGGRSLAIAAMEGREGKIGSVQPRSYLAHALSLQIIRTRFCWPPENLEA